MAIVLIIVAVLVVIGVLFLVGIRNSMIAARNRCEEAWSDIDLQLKRRHDLVPNLVETVKGYASHENSLFERVTTARAAAMAARGAGPSAQAEGQLGTALTDLRAVAENYPQLRASENFQQLAGNLAQIESQIQAARNAYNADVRAYNTKIQIFPNSLVAKLSGFERREFFAVEDGGERAPTAVNFEDSQ